MRILTDLNDSSYVHGLFEHLSPHAYDGVEATWSARAPLPARALLLPRPCRSAASRPLFRAAPAGGRAPTPCAAPHRCALRRTVTVSDRRRVDVDHTACCWRLGNNHSSRVLDLQAVIGPLWRPPPAKCSTNHQIQCQGAKS